MAALLLLALKDCVGGVSLGKALCGLAVVDAATHKPPSLLQSLKRNLVLLIPGGIGVYIGLATMGKGYRWGDRWVGTKVIWRRYAAVPPFATHGICGVCGYNLTGNVSGRCPECGTAVHLQAPDSPNASS